MQIPFVRLCVCVFLSDVLMSECILSRPGDTSIKPHSFIEERIYISALNEVQKSEHQKLLASPSGGVCDGEIHILFRLNLIMKCKERPTNGLKDEKELLKKTPLWSNKEGFLLLGGWCSGGCLWLLLNYLLKNRSHEKKRNRNENAEGNLVVWIKRSWDHRTFDGF